jgi:hypothetical protein
LAATAIAMLLSAATEQGTIRGGAELTLHDIARAVALVAPDLSPIRVAAQTIQAAVPTTVPVPILPVPQSADAGRFFDRLFIDGHGDDALLPAAIAALGPDLFSFRTVQTSWIWRTGGLAVTYLLRNTGGAPIVGRPHIDEHRENG